MKVLKTEKNAARAQATLLLFSAFLIATCGLVYELIAGTVSSYLLGDSVTQFSHTIGVYLFAMGVGSYLSRFIINGAVDKFIELEIILALVGGFAAPLLFVAFAFTSHYAYLLYTLLIIIGALVGLEIPLLLRILKDRMNFRDLVARVLSLDYIGGLAAAISFPILLLRPEVGLLKASLLAGLLNVIVAFVAIYVFQKQIRMRAHLVRACAVALALVVALVYSKHVQSYLDQELHTDPVVLSEQSHYQKIVLTSWHEYFSLFLNNNLQFNSFDEYRYHESLVHVPTQMYLETVKNIAAPLHILIMGGGDGLAVREALRYPNLQSLDLVDIDPAMTKLATHNVWLKQLNENALSDKRVKVHNEDAFLFIQKPGKKFNVIILDFPDPGNFAVGKLYSDLFFSRLRKVMEPHAVAVTQATSPLIARNAFWCIRNTVLSQKYKTLPYHTYVPSFGEWGFVAFADHNIKMPKSLMVEKKLRFLTAQMLPSLAHFSLDMGEVKTEIQTLMTQNLVHYYDSDWTRAVR